MALPSSRNRTYVDSTPVHPGDLNDLQDLTIAQRLADGGQRRFSSTFERAYGTGASWSVAMPFTGDRMKWTLPASQTGWVRINGPLTRGCKVQKVRVIAENTTVPTISLLHQFLNEQAGEGITPGSGVGLIQTLVANNASDGVAYMAYDFGDGVTDLPLAGIDGALDDGHLALKIVNGALAVTYHQIVVTYRPAVLW